MRHTATYDPFTDAHKADVLPVISLGGWFSGDAAQRAEVAGQLYAAATSSGFCYVTDHGVPEQLIRDAYAASKAFHDEPVSYKARYHINKSRHHRGWVPLDEAGKFEKQGKAYYNYHETFDLSWDMAPDDPRNHPGFGMVGPNIWPDLPGFREQVQAYYNAVYGLGRELMAAFELSLDLEPGTMLQHITIPTSQLRLLKYLPNNAPANEAHHGIDAHSDYECFTLLHTSGPGLQVLTCDGHWVEAPPIDGAFVVNIGDCLEAWTGGLFRATQHRVANLGQLRYSLPLFFATDFDVTVAPLPPFGTEAAREKYPPFVAGQHLWANTIRTFPYLRALYESGKLQVGFDVPDENPFKRISVAEAAIIEAREATPEP